MALGWFRLGRDPVAEALKAGAQRYAEARRESHRAKK